MDRLDLAPGAAAPAGVVGRVERLDHHALVAGVDGAVEERRRLRGVGGDDRGQARRRRHDRRQQLAPHAERLVDDGRRRRRAARRRSRPPGRARGRRRRRRRSRPSCPGSGAARPRRRRRAPRRRARGRRPGSAAHDGRHGPEAVGDLVQVAGVDAHLAVVAVGLDPGPVELPLDRCRTGRGERGGDVGRRATRASAARRDPAPCRSPRARRRRRVERGLRRATEVAGEHVRPPHRGDRDARRLGHRVDHHAVERALAQLAAEHLPQQVLLGLGRPGEDVRRAAPGGAALTPLPAIAGEPIDGGVDLEHRQRRLGGRRRRARRATSPTPRRCDPGAGRRSAPRRRPPPRPASSRRSSVGQQRPPSPSASTSRRGDARPPPARRTTWLFTVRPLREGQRYGVMHRRGTATTPTCTT